MTHIDNIEHIINHGITNRNSKNKNQNYKNIGDISLISSRENKKVNFNSKTIILGDFTPFYFGVRMPMLYVIQNGGNFVNQVNKSEIIYLICSLSKIISINDDFIFTDGHATDNLTKYYDSSKIGELPNIIDWVAVKESYWGGTENLELKRKKQAEFLVKFDIPENYIKFYVCYDSIAKNKLISTGISENRIKIHPNGYF